MSDLTAQLNAKIDLSIGAATKAAETAQATHKWLMDAKNGETPRRSRLNTGGIVTAAGLCIMTFPNRPTQGRYWFVRRLIIGGDTPATVVNGRADLYVSAAPYTAAEASVSDWIDFSPALPNVANYSPGEMPISGSHGEQLIIVLSGVTALQNVHANMIIEDYQSVADPFVPAN